VALRKKSRDRSIPAVNVEVRKGRHSAPPVHASVVAGTSWCAANGPSGRAGPSTAPAARSVAAGRDGHAELRHRRGSRRRRRRLDLIEPNSAAGGALPGGMRNPGSPKGVTSG